ncbi:(d)CMP kinase [Elongatibacter sediminis]|uniref:Cytidylate kinase n=1 Tax=Elongatibacter sediminis TaxID=3119006 RepID=A0AAW9R5G2_9GAMM
MTESIPVVTIDGPGGSGKGTVAMRLAERLRWHYLDSGALYRLVAVAAMDRDMDVDDEAGLGTLARELDVSFGVHGSTLTVVLDGNRIHGRLRSEPVSVFASRVAAVPAVRDALVDRQRAFRQEPGLVADGRDMGTVIFPDAELKIFLTASAEERAQRRYKQLKEKGESVNLSRLFREIEKRDERDRTRAVAPLRPAEDSHVIDSTDRSIESVLEEVLDLVQKSPIKL